jgi:hypothetical protein
MGAGLAPLGRGSCSENAGVRAADAAECSVKTAEFQDF